MGRKPVVKTATATRAQAPSHAVRAAKTTAVTKADCLSPEERRLVEEQCAQFAGLGISTAAADNIVPNIKVLQPMSPEVLAGANQIEGACAGDLLLRGAAQPLVNGEEGLWFQPVVMNQYWMRFVPREKGGGFVARYEMQLDQYGRPVPPEGAVEDPDDQFRYYFTDNGDSCTHYRFIPGIVWEDGVGLEYVFSFYGTGHTVARAWNTKWGRRRDPRTGKAHPACRYLYHVTTVQRTNNKGTWFNIETDEGHDVTGSPELNDILGTDRIKVWDMGLSLAQAFAANEKVAIAEDESVIESSTDDVPF